jgi:hypothetical protein
MIFAVGKSDALTVDFSSPGGVNTAAPLASVERSVLAGAAAVSAFVAAGSFDVAALDLLQALLANAAHDKKLAKTSENAPRETRLRLERSNCMGVSII